MSEAVFGGTFIDEETRYLTPKEAARVSRALADVSVEELTRRYEPSLLRERSIYGGPWTAEHLGTALEYVERLRGFYRTAAEDKKAVLIFCDGVGPDLGRLTHFVAERPAPQEPPTLPAPRSAQQ